MKVNMNEITMYKNSIVVFSFFFIGFCFVGIAQEPQNRWVIQLKNKNLIKNQAFLKDIHLEKQLPNSSTYVFSPSKDLSSKAQASVLNKLRQNPAIHRIEKDYIYESNVVPNDPDFPLLYGLDNIGQNGGLLEADIQILEAWQKETGDESVLVGLIDSGVDWKHPDLIDNIWQNLAEDADNDGRVLEFIGGQWVFDPGDENGIDDDGNGYIDDFIGWDFVNNDNDPSDDHFLGHGTHVAGTIAASGNNGIGISGVSWRSRVMVLKFLNDQGTGFASDATAAIDYAIAMDADLSNNSWGGGFNSQFLADAVARSQQAGQIFVTAAGNNFGNNNDRNPIYPASYTQDNILTVTATDNYDHLSNFANIGHTSVDLAAPGYGIYSTLPGGNYGYLSGTSMAAPHVAGAVCLLLSQNPQANYRQVIERILYGVDRKKLLEKICTSGGRLNVNRGMGPPFLYQTDLKLTGMTGNPNIEALGEGRLLLGGVRKDSIFISSIDPKGNIMAAMSLDLPNPDSSVFLTRFQNGQIVGAHFQAPNSDIFLAYLDTTLGILWEKVLGGNGKDNIQALLASPKEHIWVIGRSNSFSGGPEQLYLAQLDSAGTINWEKQWDLDIEIHKSLFTVEGELIVLGSFADEKIGLMGFTETGDLFLAKTYDFSGALEPQSLDMTLLENEEEGELEQSIIIAGWNKQNSIVTLCVDLEDGEINEIFSSRNTDFKGPVKLNNKGGRLFIACGSKNNPRVYGWTVDEEGNGWQTRSYSPFQGQLNFVDMAPNSEGGFMLLGKSDSTLFLWKLDRNGHASCGENSFTLIPDINSLPTENDLSGINSQTVNSSTLPLTTMGFSFTINSQILCDNTNCQTFAFFQPEAFETCEDATVSLNNFSDQATNYEWRVNGALFSTAPQTVFTASDDGAFDISLTAIQGECKDEISTTIIVDPELDVFISDTTHCGNAITLKAPIDAVSYRWLDENEQIIGTAKNQIITSSGYYELEATGICGEEESDSFWVTLQTGCMWPGDVNADGIADILDFLMLGLVDGVTGPPRSNPSTVYAAQPSLDWNMSFSPNNPFAPGVNYKHADSDGDGRVDIKNDGEIIRQNATVPGELPRDTTAGSAFLSVAANQQVLSVGDSLSFTFRLEDPTGNDINDLYGVAFSLFYNIPVAFDPNLISQNSFLNSGNDSVQTLGIPYPSQNRFDIGITRTDQININGSGMLMSMCCITVVIDDIADFNASADQVFLSLNIQNAFLIQNDGTRIPVGKIESLGLESILIQTEPDSGNQTSSSPLFGPEASIELQSIYPNPAKAHIFIDFKASHEGNVQFSLFNLAGQEILSKKKQFILGQNRSELNIKTISPGIYLLKVNTEKGNSIFKKIIIR